MLELRFIGLLSWRDHKYPEGQEEQRSYAESWRSRCGLMMDKGSRLLSDVFSSSEKCEIGADSFINQGCHIDVTAGWARIGRNVNIRPSVKLITSSHEIADPTPVLENDGQAHPHRGRLLAWSGMYSPARRHCWVRMCHRTGATVRNDTESDSFMQVFRPCRSFDSRSRAAP
jgi:hypothetical protein